MSKIDENEIRRRLELLSQIEPDSEAANRAIKRVRDTLTEEGKKKENISLSVWRLIFTSSIIKFAAAAVILICAGYIAGQHLSTQPIDVEQLRAELEASLTSSIQQDLLEQMNQRWQSALATSCAELKDELHQQVRRDLAEFAAQTLAASSTLTEQRLKELIQLIEAARLRDRLRVAAALEKIEMDKTQLGNGLQALAAQTDKLLHTEQN